MILKEVNDYQMYLLKDDPVFQPTFLSMESGKPRTRR